MMACGFVPARTLWQPPWCYGSTGPYTVIAAGPPAFIIASGTLDEAIWMATSAGQDSHRVVVFDANAIVVYARDFTTGEFAAVKEVADLYLSKASSDETAMTMMAAFDACRTWAEEAHP